MMDSHKVYYGIFISIMISIAYIKIVVNHMSGARDDYSGRASVDRSRSGPGKRDQTGVPPIEALDVAVVHRHCNKPRREMADDPAASGPYRIASRKNKNPRERTR
jgi:hypothetical protein